MTNLVILAVLLYILADVAPLYHKEHAQAVHDMWTLLGHFALTGATIRLVASFFV
jgi:hypothetical protein